VVARIEMWDRGNGYSVMGSSELLPFSAEFVRAIRCVGEEDQAEFVGVKSRIPA
jgi:hypothetical protein